MKRIVRDVEIEGGQNGAISGNRAVGGKEAKCLHVRRGVGEIIMGVSGSFDKGPREIKIIQDFESARIKQKNTESRVGNNVSVACCSRTNEDATPKSMQFGQIWQFTAAQFMGTGRAGPVGG
jgi:hypothetical protein